MLGMHPSRKASKRLKRPLRRPASIVTRTSGSIHSASTRKLTRSSKKRSTPCTPGTPGPECVTHTLPTLMIQYYASTMKASRLLCDNPDASPEVVFTRASSTADSGLLLFELGNLGTKASMAELIGSITLIEVDYLTKPPSIESASVAKRMSWAAHRQTRRIEDIPYSLIGIFLSY